MNWLKNKLRVWLGITENQRRIKSTEDNLVGLTSIGVDVHFKSPHMILIFSKLKGGQIRHIEADFKNMRELQDLVERLKTTYKPQRVWWDCPWPDF